MSGDPSLMIDAVQPVELLHPLNRGLVTWLLAMPGRIGGQKWPDLTRFGDGTIINSAVPPNAVSGWQPQATRPGGFGALGFDGSDDYVVTPTNRTFSSLTLCCWVRLDAAGTYPIAVSHTNAGLFELRFFNTSKQPEFTYSSDSARSATATNLGQWYHLVGTANGVKLCLYVDGVQKAETASVFTPEPGLNYVGSRGGSSLFLTGQIDDVRVYNRAISSYEVAALYDASRRGHPDTLRRLKRRAYSFGSTSTGNRRRRVICGS